MNSKNTDFLHTMGKEISPSSVTAEIDDKIVETSKNVENKLETKLGKELDNVSKVNSSEENTKKVEWEDLVSNKSENKKKMRRSLMRRGSSALGFNADSIGTIHSVNIKSPTSVLDGATEEQMKAYLVLAMTPEKLQEDQLTSSSESKNEVEQTLNVPATALPSLEYESDPTDQAGKTTLKKEDKSQAGDVVGDIPPMQNATEKNETLETNTTASVKPNPFQIFFFCFKKNRG